MGAFELDFYNKDGAVRTLETREKLIWEKERVVEVHGIGRDITERKQAEEALRESEERYRNLLELAPVGIAVQVEGKIVFTNTAGAQIIGAQSPEEITGRDISTIIHPDYVDRSLDRIRRMMAGEQGLYPDENVYVRLDGTPVSVDVIAAPVTYGGKPAVQVIVTDISKRKEAERAIRESEERYRELVENIADIIYVTNEDGKLVFLNAAAEQFIGYSREELLGLTFADFLTPESIETAASVFRRQRAGEDVGVFELDLYDKSGTIKTIETREQLVWDGDRIVAFHGIGRRHNGEEAGPGGAAGFRTALPGAGRNYRRYRLCNGRDREDHLSQ